jgi:hypothetical protein
MGLALAPSKLERLPALFPTNPSPQKPSLRQELDVEEMRKLKHILELGLSQFLLSQKDAKNVSSWNENFSSATPTAMTSPSADIKHRHEYRAPFGLQNQNITAPLFYTKQQSP